MIRPKQTWYHKNNGLKLTILCESPELQDHWSVGLQLSDHSGTHPIMTCHIHKSELLESNYWYQSQLSNSKEA